MTIDNLVGTLLDNLPLGRDLFRLAATCVDAVTALRRHKAASYVDYGKESVPVSVVGPPQGHPPLPLEFTYTGTASRAPAETWVAGSSDGSCGEACSCCGGDTCRTGLTIGTGRVSTAAAGRDDFDEDSVAEAGNGSSSSSSSRDAGNGVEGSSSEDEQADGNGARRCGCGVVVPGGFQAYDPALGRLLPPLLGSGSSAAFLLECGPACACHAASCPARLTQRGLAARVALRWCQDKGWRATAGEPIPVGCFVCCYIGEYVTSAEAGARLRRYDERGHGHALLVVREMLPSGLVLRINIDATHVGNVARFFNHSCDGGTLVMVVVRQRGSLLPAVALFASRDIAAGEELTFAYGPPAAGPPGNRSTTAGWLLAGTAGEPGMGLGAAQVAAQSGGKDGGEAPAPTQPAPRRQPQRCRCGTSACLGFMPSEEA